ncbi:MAG: hypothetical protein Q8R42_01080 [Desulfocapsaceae bacterium]|nr:hypothetical protein [Desulfocapsaceae bacterium]
MTRIIANVRKECDILFNAGIPAIMAASDFFTTSDALTFALFVFEAMISSSG